MNRRHVLPAVVAALVLGAVPASAARGSHRAGPVAYDWPQFGFDQAKSADDTAETTVSLSNVAKLKQLFKVPLTDVPDGAPVLLSGVSTANGVRDLVFLQGEHGHLTAFDAHTGAQVWTKNFGPGGITNTAPAIDPNRRFIYVNANDGKVHKVQVTDGTEITGGGWPEQAGPGKASSQLTIATAKSGVTYLYASNQGHGHVTTIDLATGSQHVFNLACSDRPDIHFGAPGAPSGCTVNGADPWARSPSYDAALDRLFQMGGTNNGSTWSAGHVWRQSWVALAPDGSTKVTSGKGYPLDSYTPTNWAATVKSDQDIGSGGMLILPTGLSAKYPDIGVQPGKDHMIRLLNLADLGGKGGPGNLGGELGQYDFSKMSMMRSQGAVWTNPKDGGIWVLVPGENGIAGFQVTVNASGVPQLNLKWTIFNGWTTSAFVANGVLYAADGGGEHTTTLKSHQIQAIDPVTGKIAWAAPIGVHHWSSPILANGILYMPDGNSGGFGTGTTGDLTAWSLGQPRSSGELWRAVQRRGR